MIKLTRYRDPWSDDPEMNCYRPEYPYGEVIEPLIEKKEEGYFVTEQELNDITREAAMEGYALAKNNKTDDNPFREINKFYSHFNEWLAKQLKEATDD